MAASATRRRAKPKLTRAERNEAVRARLFAAAAKVVGRHGYADASVSRITTKAGVAQGTFYHHFRNRQEVLDELLPSIGRRMLDFIARRIDRAASEEEKEIARFRGFFDFLQEVPEFLRILNEAEFFAPAGYQRHIDMIAEGYMRILRRGRDSGTMGDFTNEELEVVGHILLGARAYLSRRYAYDGTRVHSIPEHVVSAYAKLLRGGLFTAGRSAVATAPRLARGGG